MADPARARRERRRRVRRRRTVAVAAGLAVAAGGSAVGVAATNNDGQALRLATVARGSVTQSIETSGSIASSAKYTPSFATSGTVKEVDVAVGQTVRKGQTIATLDTTSLQSALDSARATLARDRQQLEADKTGQTSASGSTQTAVDTAFVRLLTTAAPSGGGAGNGGSGGGGDADLVARIKAAQQAVIAAQQALDAAQAEIDAAQHTVDADVTGNTQLRDAQVAACGTTSPPASPSTDCTSAMAAYQASADALAADVATLDTKIAAQDANTTALDAAISALDLLVHKLTSTSDGSTTGTPTSGGPTTQGGSSSGSSRTSSSGSSNGSGSSNSSNGSAGAASEPASAAQLAADQAAIDAARALVTVAEQDLAAATLTSPINGQVAAIGLTAGASSAGQAVTVVGTGVQGVSVTVPLPQIDQVKPGQRVTVAADGRASVLHGTVTSVGLVSTTSGSTTSFPVAIRLDARSPHLYDGTGADVVIVTGTATDVPVVPNSAIHSGLRSSHTVTIVKNGKAKTEPVTVGIAGSQFTQITSGLKAGQQVEIADPSQSLPSSTSSNTGFGGFGGLGRFVRQGGS